MTLKKLALTLLLMTGMAAGQGFRWNGPQIVDSTGRPVPNATVRVCNEPTSTPTSCDTPSNIYSDRGLTSPLSNPTTADSHGNPHFYALAGRYHIQITDPSITQIDIPDEILVQDGTYPQVNYTAVTFSATPTFDASIGTIFAITLTANVTSSTVSNPSLGRLIEFQICQDGTGGRTFAWPADFDSTPTMDARASKCRQSAWFYNGTKWKQFGQGGDSLGLPSGSQITNGGAVLTLPTTTDTLVGRDTTDTLTQKILRTVDGSSGAPSQSWVNETTSGWYRSGSGDFRFQVGSNDQLRIQATDVTLKAGSPLRWGSLGVTSADTGASRTGPAAIAFGNGAQGDTSAALAAASITSSFISLTANPATAGLGRFATGDAINWRNNANLANLNGVSKDASDIFQIGDAAGIKLAGPIFPTAAGGQTLGKNSLPFSSVYIGNAATNNIQLTGTGTSAKVATLPDNTGTIAELNLAQNWSASQTYNDGSFAGGNAPKAAVVTGTYTNATTTFSDVTNMSWAIGANTNYTLTCHIMWQGSANTAGPKFQITGPASPTSTMITLSSAVTATTSIYAGNGGAAFSSPVANTGAVTAATNFPATVVAGIVNGVNSGTLKLQAAANGVGTLTIQADSYCVAQ